MRSAEPFISAGFARFFRAQAVSGLGTYVSLTALQILVVSTMNGTATDVGLVNAAKWLPYIVFGIVVGAIVDVRRRLPLMIGTDVVQGLLMALIPAMWWFDVLSLPALLVVVMAYGTAGVIGGAASTSFLPRLVGRQQIQPAHARLDGADAAASTAGPALAGALVSVLSAPLVFIIDTLAFFYSAITLRAITHEEPPPRTGLTARLLVAEIVQGVRWIYRGSSLVALAVATHGWFVGHAIVQVLLAPYALGILSLSEWQYGAALAAGGVGAIIGASITTRIGRRLGTGRTIIMCHVITTFGVIAMCVAAQGNSAAAAVILFGVGQWLYGLAMGMSNSHEMSYRQLVTPDELQARTNTTLRSLNRAVIVVIAPLTGILADTWGIRPMLVVSALVFTLVAVGMAASSIRTLQAPE